MLAPRSGCKRSVTWTGWARLWSGRARCGTIRGPRRERGRPAPGRLPPPGAREAQLLLYGARVSLRLPPHDVALIARLDLMPFTWAPDRRRWPPVFTASRRAGSSHAGPLDLGQ